MLEFLLYFAAFLAALPLLNFLSYRIMGAIIRHRRKKWDLNICCGKTDGGGVNVDIVRHADIPNLVVVEDIYHLPFSNGEFEHTLCSHTIEHVEDPEAFYRELQRVSKEVILVVPPLWDLCAAFNVLEHRSLFLTLRKEHRNLPRHIPLPFSQAVQERMGQRIRA